MHSMVPENVQKATTKCRCTDTINCADCKRTDFCEVNYADGENVLFVHTKMKPDCNYNFSYGHGYICTCPTNFYLHTHNLR
jgi:hypothetical protein